jgi:hypothetical protein
MFPSRKDFQVGFSITQGGFYENGVVMNRSNYLEFEDRVGEY